MASFVHRMSSTETIEVTAQPMINGIVRDILKPLQEPMFLQTRSAQVIAGIFVWSALFITCQQVYILLQFTYFMVTR